MSADSSPQHFLPYGKQTIEQDDIDAVIEALQSDFLTTGPTIAKFEKALAEETQSKEAVVVGNGTQALHLACLATGLKDGDYAVVPSLTFLATANAVRYCGADVLFCDVDPLTGLIDLKHLEHILKEHQDKNIKAILPVHLAGQVADLEGIQNLVEGRNIKIIADSCHALGSQIEDYNVGSCQYEDMSTFSFHPVKTIAMGEGGAITLNDSALANKMRSIRSHAMEHDSTRGAWFYEMKELGYNYRATDIQCALGLSQIKKLKRFVEKRRVLAQLYDELLKPFAPNILSPSRIKGQSPALHLYAPRFDFDAIGKSRDQVMRELKEKSVGTQVHYIPVHTQPYYQKLYGNQTLPGAAEYYQKTLSLPFFPVMEEVDVKYVVQTLSEVCGL